MRIYFYNENHMRREGISRIVEENELPDGFDGMTRTDQEEIVAHTEDCSFFQGTREEIAREAKKWAELPEAEENVYMKSIGRAVLDALQ